MEFEVEFEVEFGSPMAAWLLRSLLWQARDISSISAYFLIGTWVRLEPEEAAAADPAGGFGFVCVGHCNPCICCNLPHRPAPSLRSWCRT